MKLKRIIATAFALVSVLVCAAGCKPSVEDIPNYTAYKQNDANNHAFESYAYSGLSDGFMEQKGLDWYCGHSLITLEQMKMYKECGFDVLMPQSVAVAGSDTLKTVMDLALQAGLKVIVTDNSIYQGASVNPMEVNGKVYATEEALDAQVKAWMSRYWDHPAFYGVMMEDEISNAKLHGSYGDLYKSVRRVLDENGHADKHIHANTMAMSVWSGYTEHGEVPTRWTEISNEEYLEILGPEFEAQVDAATEAAGGELPQETFWEMVNAFANSGARRDEYQAGIMWARFEAFVRKFFEVTDADHIAIDHYPLYASGPMGHTIMSYQICSMIAEELGKEFHVVTQTMSYVPNNADSRRYYKEHDMRFMNDMMLGFGVDCIMYFTYFVHGDDNAGFFLEECSFVTWYGERTEMWYFMQKIMADNQAFANTIKNFDYVTSRVYKKKLSGYDVSYVEFARNMGEFTKLKAVETDQSYCLITEMRDNSYKKGTYMYMVQNPVDSQWRTAATHCSTTLTFADEYKYALLWVNGVQTKVALDENHQLVVDNPAGQATFVLPYNA